MRDNDARPDARKAGDERSNFAREAMRIRKLRVSVLQTGAKLRCRAVRPAMRGSIWPIALQALQAADSIAAAREDIRAALQNGERLRPAGEPIQNCARRLFLSARDGGSARPALRPKRV